MNLVEIYLEEVIDIEEYVPEWSKSGEKFVKVNGKWSSYGCKYEEVKLFSMVHWKDVTEKGYYLG